MDTLVSAPEDLLGFRGGFFNRSMREARLVKGLTQMELAMLVKDRLPHFNDQAISAFETLREFPKPEVQEAISDILGRPVSELFPPWLQEMRQDRAIREVPLTVLSQLAKPDVKALQAFNRAADEFDVEEAAIWQTLSPKVKAVLEGLTQRERRVLELRFGLDGHGTHTLKEIAHEFNLHQERIRQIEARALRKLRHPSRSRKLNGFLRDEEPLEGVHLFQRQVKELSEANASAAVAITLEVGKRPSPVVIEHWAKEITTLLKRAQRTLRQLDPASWGWGREMLTPKEAAAIKLIRKARRLKEELS